MCGCICARLDLRGQAGLRAFGPVRMNVYTCVLDMGRGHLLWSGGTLTVCNPCKIHVLCSIYKNVLEWFLREDYAEAMGGWCRG